MLRLQARTTTPSLQCLDKYIYLKEHLKGHRKAAAGKAVFAVLELETLQLTAWVYIRMATWELCRSTQDLPVLSSSFSIFKVKIIVHILLLGGDWNSLSVIRACAMFEGCGQPGRIIPLIV